MFNFFFFGWGGGSKIEIYLKIIKPRETLSHAVWTAIKPSVGLETVRSHTDHVSYHIINSFLE